MKTVVLLNICQAFIRQQYLFEIEVFCDNASVFTVTYDQSYACLPNKGINVFITINKSSCWAHLKCNAFFQAGDQILPDSPQTIPDKFVFSEDQFLDNTNAAFLKLTPQWFPYRLNCTYRVRMKANQWKWKTKTSIKQISWDTLWKLRLPSMTTYCRHFPGVAFKRSTNFSSSAITGASWY